ncbi:biotin-dependent carboxyltransferase family protein [Jejudonia soesokkakensis]|uniref:Biotin-dependent carboxyltransferase family protein n=1 Tax=Jejudonia soesokkakensis TaxID=1323432 RepID=A0ABW2MS13_9FLAO
MIEVLSAGLVTTLQDRGRFGSRSMGVPVSGTMDGHSAMLANALVRNASEAAVLECVLMGPKLFFDENALIAVTGAHFQPTIDGKPIALNKSIKVSRGSTLNVGSAVKGMYGYISIQGGFVSEIVLGSQSFYKGITKKAALEKGDVLKFNSSSIFSEALKTNLQPLDFNQHIVEVIAGPEFNKLSKFQQHLVLKSAYKIAPQSNRMAIVFEDKRGVGVSEILTAPVQPGTVQITPSGKLIILMRDAQTTGGYGRIFQLTEAAIHLLSQQRPGFLISLKLI